MFWLRNKKVNFSLLTLNKGLTIFAKVTTDVLISKHHYYKLFLLTFVSWKPLGTLANSEDSDEMQHNAAFHQGLHCLLRIKKPSGTEI